MWPFTYVCNVDLQYKCNLWIFFSSPVLLLVLCVCFFFFFYGFFLKRSLISFQQRGVVLKVTNRGFWGASAASYLLVCFVVCLISVSPFTCAGVFSVCPFSCADVILLFVVSLFSSHTGVFLFASFILPPLVCFRCVWLLLPFTCTCVFPFYLSVCLSVCLCFTT